MGHLGRRIGLSQDKGNSTPGSADGAVGGGILDLITHEYFNRQEKIFNESTVLSEGISATGGVISDYTVGSDVYRAHIFTSSGTFSVTGLGDFGSNVQYLVVAGGGGGGGNVGGGGGAGGYRTNLPGSPGDHTTSVAYPVSASPGDYTVTVGGGGVGGINTNQTPDGSDSVFGTITALRGGGGGARTPGSNPVNPGRAGGSGGGGAGAESGTIPGGASTAVTTPSPWPGPATQGKAGGAGAVDPQPAAGGGGGGAGGAGTNGETGGAYGGNGGAGLPSVIAYGPTNAITYAGGGGGGVHPPSPGTSGGSGGTGGGGAGSDNTEDGNNATYSTGGGGGGGSNGRVGGNGASGIVVVRYQIGTIQAAKATGGYVSFYNGKTIHTFFSSGSFVTPGTFNETCEYVAIGGGGSGGGRNFRGGGGGAGAYHHNSVPIDNTGPGNPVSTTITIGGGGSYVSPEGPGGNGAATTLGTGFSVTAAGGGMGGGYEDPRAGIAGGSGGGAGGYPGGSDGAAGDDPGPATGDAFPGTANDNTPSNGWGYRGGGRGSEGRQQGGGGGGAGGQGIPSDSGDYPSTYGRGGPGVQLPTTFRDPRSTPGGTGGTSPSTPQSGGGLGYQNPSGTSWYVGGGGNGGGYSKPTGVNPSVETFVPAGGGGTGAINGPGNSPEPEHPVRVTGWPGAVNSGSGGGGSSPQYDNLGPGHGGSGLVLIAYPT